MDIARPEAKRQKTIRRYTYAGAALLVIVVITAALARLKPAAPAVDRSTIWTDTVKRGAMLREVRGLGTLVPETVWVIPAATEGRVEKRSVLDDAQRALLLADEDPPVGRDLHRGGRVEGLREPLLAEPCGQVGRETRQATREGDDDDGQGNRGRSHGGSSRRDRARPRSTWGHKSGGGIRQCAGNRPRWQVMLLTLDSGGPRASNQRRPWKRSCSRSRPPFTRLIAR